MEYDDFRLPGDLLEDEEDQHQIFKNKVEEMGNQFHYFCDCFDVPTTTIKPIYNITGEEVQGWLAARYAMLDAEQKKVDKLVQLVVTKNRNVLYLPCKIAKKAIFFTRIYVEGTPESWKNPPKFNDETMMANHAIHSIGAQMLKFFVDNISFEQRD